MKKIMIIDDEIDFLTIAKMNLEATGKYEIMTLLSGVDIIKYVAEFKPDIILLDIVMPIMDGITMLKELRKDKWGKDACVIMLTNLNESGKVSESLEKGVHDYLIKTDWSLKDLVKKVKRKLS